MIGGQRERPAGTEGKAKGVCEGLSTDTVLAKDQRVYTQVQVQLL